MGTTTPLYCIHMYGYYNTAVLHQYVWVLQHRCTAYTCMGTTTPLYCIHMYGYYNTAVLHTYVWVLQHRCTAYICMGTTTPLYSIHMYGYYNTAVLHTYVWVLQLNLRKQRVNLQLMTPFCMNFAIILSNGYLFHQLEGKIWLKFEISNFQSNFVGWSQVSYVKLPSDERHRTSLMISQHWFR